MSEDDYEGEDEDGDVDAEFCNCDSFRGGDHDGRLDLDIRTGEGRKRRRKRRRGMRRGNEGFGIGESIFVVWTCSYTGCKFNMVVCSSSQKY